MNLPIIILKCCHKTLSHYRQGSLSLTIVGYDMIKHKRPNSIYAIFVKGWQQRLLGSVTTFKFLLLGFKIFWLFVDCTLVKTAANQIHICLNENKSKNVKAFYDALREAFKNPSHGKILLRGRGVPPLSR